MFCQHQDHSSDRFSIHLYLTTGIISFQGTAYKFLAENEFPILKAITEQFTTLNSPHFSTESSDELRLIFPYTKIFRRMYKISSQASCQRNTKNRRNHHQFKRLWTQYLRKIHEKRNEFRGLWDSAYTETKKPDLVDQQKEPARSPNLNRSYATWKQKSPKSVTASNVTRCQLNSKINFP